MMKLSYNALIALSVLVASSMVGDSEAATYVVGDSLGWQVPPGGASDYSAWASQHVFRTGDVLVFNFTTGFHDVARVSRQAFDSCLSSNPITLVTVGPANLTLNSTGSDYYICTFGSHCSLGQRLEINVTSSASTSPPSPSPIPNPSPAPSTPGASTPNPSPAPSSPQAPTPAPSTVPQPPPSSMSPGPSPNGPVTPSPISPGTESAPPPTPRNPIPIFNQPPPPPPNAAPVVGFGSPVVVMACVLLSLIMV